MPSRPAGWLVLIGMIAVCFTLSYFMGEAQGWMLGTAIGVITMFIQFSWPLRKEWWFWVLAATFAMVQVAGVFRLDWSWTARATGKALGTLALTDLLVMVAITYGIYRLKYGTPVQAIEPSADDCPSYAERDLDL